MLRYHDAYVPLYERPLPPKDARLLTTTSCQVAKQYVYVVKHFGTHTVRGVWESAAGDAAKQRLLTSLNVGNASWVLITDHKAKKNPSKSDTEQGIFLSLPHVASLFLSLPLFLPHLITIPPWGSWRAADVSNYHRLFIGQG